MTQAVVTLDDGTKVRITFDGETAAAPSADSGIGAARGIGAAATQGMTLGFGDEIGAAAVALSESANKPSKFEPALPTFNFDNFGSVFNDVLAAERANNQAFSEQNPLTSLASTVGGAIATAPLTARALPAVAGPTVLSRIGQAGLGGAKIGAVSGAGFADGDAADIAQGAAEGATLGFATGSAFQSLGSGFQALKNKFRPDAQRQLSQLAEAEGLTPTEIKTRLTALGPSATLADVAESFRMKADSAVSRLGSASKKVKELIRRDESSLTRIMEPIKRALGGQAEKAQTISQIKEIQEQVAAPLYAQARAIGAPQTKELDALLKRPAVQQAWREAKRLGASDPDIDPAMLGEAARPSIDGWQRITQRLNSGIAKALRDGDKNKVDILSRLRNNINAELDAANLAYAEARRVWSGTAAANDMMELGESFLKMPADQLKELTRGLSQADLAFFRVGAGRAIETRLASKADTANLARMFKNQSMRDKVRSIFPDATAAEDFLNTVQAEAIFKTTASKIGQGSQTFSRQIVDAQAGGSNVASSVSPRNILTRALGSVGASSERTLDDIGNMLLSTDPVMQSAAIRLMESRGLPASQLGIAPATLANIFPSLRE